MSPVMFVHLALRNCAVHLSYNYEDKIRMPKKDVNPFQIGYDTELDTISKFSVILFNYNQHPSMDGWTDENQSTNWCVVMVVPFSTP